MELPADPATFVSDMLVRLRDGGGTENVAAIRSALQHTMDVNASVYRTEQTLKQAEVDIAGLKERYQRASVTDRGFRYNTDLLEAVELGFLLDLAEVLVVSARARNESRGGHFREDFPHRDDVNFMRHTMAYRQGPSGAAPALPLAPRRPGRGDPARLQAGVRDPLRADGAEVLVSIAEAPPAEPAVAGPAAAAHHRKSA